MKKLVFDSSFGRISLSAEDDIIKEFKFSPEEEITEGEEDPLLSEAKNQLLGYFSGERKEFSLPYTISGTDFEIKVRREIEKIGFGETRTYGEIAAAINVPGGARAVGRACGGNPLAIIVPCHRVVCSGEKTGGYAFGILLKQKLLRHEKDNLSRRT